MFQFNKLNLNIISFIYNYIYPFLNVLLMLLFFRFKMPKQISEIKDFLLTARRTDAKSVKIKKNKSNTKFKVVYFEVSFRRFRCFLLKNH